MPPKYKAVQMVHVVGGNFDIFIITNRVASEFAIFYYIHGIRIPEKCANNGILHAI